MYVGGVKMSKIEVYVNSGEGYYAVPEGENPKKGGMGNSPKEAVLDLLTSMRSSVFLLRNRHRMERLVILETKQLPPD